MGSGAALVGLRQNSVLLGETSDAVVRFAHSSDLSADSVGLDGVGHASGGLIDINQVDLDGGMVLGVDDSVTGRAKSRNKTKGFEVKFLTIILDGF